MVKNAINQTSSKPLTFFAGANLFKGFRNTRHIKNENLMWSIVPKTRNGETIQRTCNTWVV